jgi:hypothetical protein
MRTPQTASEESTLSDTDLLDIVLGQEQQMKEGIQDLIDGLITLLIVRGPPGIGKTETLRRMTQAAKVISTDYLATKWEPNGEAYAYPYNMAEGKPVTVKGALIRGSDYSPWSLYADLYANREQGILCLDDNDTILTGAPGEVAMSIIQRATEHNVTREIGYTKAAMLHELKLMGVPATFETNCPIAVNTNTDMLGHIDAAKLAEQSRGKMPAKHIKRWEAMISRGTYIDLEMNTPRAVRVFCEYFIDKNQILTKSEYLKEKFGRNLTKAEAERVKKWIRANQTKLANRLDLRTYTKVAMSFLERGTEWEKSAEVRFLRSVA